MNKLIKWIPIYGLLWKERYSYMYDWTSKEDNLFGWYHAIWLLGGAAAIGWGILKFFGFI